VSSRRTLPFDARPSPRYNGTMIWVRNLTLAALGFVALLLILGAILTFWPTSSETRIEVENAIPTPLSCKDLIDKYGSRTPYSDEPGTGAFIECGR
jgi:hypothetical protein